MSTETSVYQSCGGLDRRVTIALWLLLFAYPVLHVWQGIDFTDTGVLLSMHQQFFNDPECVEFRALMWLANLLNAIWLKLTSGTGLVGARLGAAVGYGLCGVTTYAALRPYVRPRTLLCGILLSMVLVLRGGSHFLSYNALTSLLFLLSSLAILRGVPARSRFLLWGAGFFMGISIFVRLPNLAGAALVLGVPFYGFLVGRKPGEILSQMVRFAAGWIVGLGAMIAGIFACGHAPIVWASIVNEMGPSPTAHYDAYYAPSYMLRRLFTDHLIALGLAALVCLVLVGLSRGVPRVARRGRSWLFAAVLIGGLAVFAAFPFVYGFSVITYAWTGVCYLGAVSIAFGCCNASAELRLAAFVAATHVFLVPLGSGNGMNNAIFGFWMATPLVFVAASPTKDAPRVLRWMKPEGAAFARVVVVSMLLLCALYNAFVGVYRDYPNRFRLTVPVDHPMLHGIRTTTERARVLSEVLAELDVRVKPNNYMMVFEHMPLLHFITHTRPYVRGPWPLVKRPEVFGRALEQAEAEGMPPPIIVRAKGDPSNGMWPYGRAATDRSQRMRHIKGREYMDAFIDRHSYGVAWSNAGFEILVPGTESE